MQAIKIIYIFHDCFVVKTDKAVLVFDFWKDPYQHHQILPNPLLEVDRNLPVYVFVSHRHKDHYNPTIFDWSEHFTNIRYVVSEDVRKGIHHILSTRSVYKGVKVDSSRVIVLSDHDSFSDDNLKIDSFPSTDVGNSYAVTIDGFTLFHAGDLNAWIWKDESTEEEVEEALSRYEEIVETIATRYSGFDFCFFPVDSRIGTDYFTGAKIFLDRFKIGNFFPMHYELGEKVSDMARLHRDAAAFELYRSRNCQHYIMSAPYSAYSIIKE